MRVRSVVVAVLAACVLSVPVAATGSAGAVVASANGGAHWTIPLPNAFDVEVQNRTLAFNARRYEDGSASGQFEYQQLAGGEVFNRQRRGRERAAGSVEPRRVRRRGRQRGVLQQSPTASLRALGRARERPGGGLARVGYGCNLYEARSSRVLPAGLERDE
jgi:hypothetical protein